MRRLTNTTSQRNGLVNPNGSDSSFVRIGMFFVDSVWRPAVNNLSALLAGQGRLADAQALLRDAVARFPDDPKVLNNLAEITARRGDQVEARRLFEALVRKFPAYEPGLRNYRKRYGDKP